jgi:hypothetical protein
MDNAKLMGLSTPGDQKVPVPVRTWDAAKRALWRSKISWDVAMKQTAGILERCAHMEGCPAQTSETATCLADCPDRELRMSALVILNAARQFGPLDAKRLAEGPYFAPSREGFSDMVAELAACRAELAELKGTPIELGALEASTEPKPVATIAAEPTRPQLEMK